MRIGYARVSTTDQSLEAQVDALKSAGCDEIVEETASGGRWHRRKLQNIIEALKPDDTLVVVKLDRLSRSLIDLLFLIDKISAKGAAFESLSERVETSSAAGRMLLQMLGTFAEFERAMIRERTQAGLKAARKKGIRLGRKPALNKHQKTEIIAAIRSGSKTQAEAAELFRVHPSTVSRLMRSALSSAN